MIGIGKYFIHADISVNNSLVYFIRLVLATGARVVDPIPIYLAGVVAIPDCWPDHRCSVQTCRRYSLVSIQVGPGDLQIALDA